MKVSFIIQDLFQQGAQYVTSLMATGFINKGYEVDILVSKFHDVLLRKGNIEPFKIPESVNLIILRNVRARNNINEIREYLRNGKCDVIIAMDPNYTTAIAIASLGLPRKPQLAYVEHSGLAGFDRNSMEMLQPQKYNPRWLINKFLLTRFDTVMAVSTGTAKAIERSMNLKPNSVKVVYNPVVDDLYRNKLKQSPRHPWLMDKNCPIVVAAGAHCGVKNHYMLFNAIKMVNEQRTVKLILFGKGNLTSDYKEWIAKNGMSDIIDLPGHTDNLPAEIKAADAFIVSSNLESFSIVLVEALAAGTPVISTNCPFGPSELLADGEYGTLVPVGDSERMSEAILDVVSKPKTLPPIKSWEPFAVENVVDSYINALKI